MQKIKNRSNFFDVDFSFILIFVFAFLIGQFRFYVIYVLFLILHELSHFFVAKKLGFYPKKIKLSFFGAALEGDDDFLTKDEIKIVLAGPLFNLVIIIFCYLCFWFFPESYGFLYEILQANIAIFFFNMLPIFPLDFGRFLLLLLSLKTTRNRCVKIVKKISLIFVSILFLLYFVSMFFEFSFGLGLAAVNLLFLIFSETEDTSYKRQIFAQKKLEKLKAGLLGKIIYVDENTPDYALFKFIDDSHYFEFAFLSEDKLIVSKVGEIEFYRRNNLL